MAGYTDAAMRLLCSRFGCGLTFTEVVNAAALIRESRRTFHLLETLPQEGPVGAHLYGSEAEVLAAAAARVEQLGRFSLVDINCGCPVRKIVVKGAGVALMGEPGKIGRIVRAVRQAVKLPVTVKARLGHSRECENISEVAHAVEEAGGAALFIHARYAEGRHTGPVAWEAVARVKSERGIPVVGNGGVTSAAEALDMLHATGADGVMIGRAAVGNPWLFAEIRHVLQGEKAVEVSTEERRSVILEHLEHIIALHAKARACRGGRGVSAERVGVLRFRGHLLKYLGGLRRSGEARRRLNNIKTVEEVISLVDWVLESG